ncbi:MAG: CrcB family protein [Actinomycetota bacterium]
MGRNLRPLAVVALGGAIGSVLRWALVALGPSDAGDGIVFGINVVGSLLLGALLGRRERLSDSWRLGLGTGFAGGLTTFSGYAVAVAERLDDGSLLAATANGLGTPVAALLAAGLGYRLSRLIGARPSRSRRARATGRAAR